MEFEISKRVQSEEGEENLKEEQVCNQLQLKSSETQTQALNKRAVLNRIRDHKCIHKIKSLLLTTAGSNKGSTVDADNRWIDSGDVFSCPWTRLILWRVYVNVCRVCDFRLCLLAVFNVWIIVVDLDELMNHRWSLAILLLGFGRMQLVNWAVTDY